VLVVALTQLAWIAPDADRGIHMIFRVVLVILALSRSHAKWSIDAWVWARWKRPYPAMIAAWPRYLILLQLLWIYFSGGLNKSGAEWGPGGGFMALANALTDPHLARFDPAWIGAVLPLTQLATAATLVFELSAPLYLVWLYCAETADRPGSWRRWINRLRLRWLWVGTGVLFHAGLVIALPIGIFPWGMLALYPVLLRPAELTR
ncbi:MAG: HTTM domain-containing protein, partial [Deltaproteobacteria bacterium]|nr:HTTM domain-containing protein [Deltaproteobacteria bacterium]